MYKRKFEAFSCNLSCSGKKLVLHINECVSVALATTRAMPMRILLFVACTALQCFLHTIL